MFSNVKYPRFSGTSVPRDFVEYPSQVNEMWATWPEVLHNYAKHYKTGEPMPQALLDKVKAAEKFNQGFKTTEYLAASLLDQAWHQLNPPDIPNDAVAFEAEACTRPASIFRRCRRVIAASISHMHSPAVTRPVITRISGAKCSTPTPSSGSSNTAD